METKKTPWYLSDLATTIISFAIFAFIFWFCLYNNWLKNHSTLSGLISTFAFFIGSSLLLELIYYPLEHLQEQRGLLSSCKDESDIDIESSRTHLSLLFFFGTLFFLFHYTHLLDNHPFIQQAGSTIFCVFSFCFLVPAFFCAIEETHSVFNN